MGEEVVLAFYPGICYTDQGIWWKICHRCKFHGKELNTAPLEYKCTVELSYSV